MTLRSLSASIPADTEVYVSDDGSDNPKIRKYLTTNEKVKVNAHPFPNHDPGWLKFVGVLPNYDYIKGVAGQVNVLLREQPCGIKNFTLAVAKIFQQHQCSHIIKAQDDVIFKEGWYSTLCNILENTNASLVSGFRYFISPTQTLRKVHPNAEELLSGNVGAPLMAISRKACENNKILLCNNNTLKRNMDHFWIDNCRKTGMPILVTNPGLCQHIGFDSLIYPETSNGIMFGEKTRVDQNLSPPYAIAHEVAKMGQTSIVTYMDAKLY